MGDPEDRAPDQTSEENEPADDADLEVKSDDPTASQLFFGDHLEKVGSAKLKSSEPEVPEDKLADSASDLFFGESLEKAATDDEAAAPGEDDDSSGGGTAE